MKLSGVRYLVVGKITGGVLVAGAVVLGVVAQVRGPLSSGCAEQLAPTGGNLHNAGDGEGIRQLASTDGRGPSR